MAVLTANQGAMQTTNTPVGYTWRGIGSNLLNAEEIAKEDWMRNEQASNNQLVRDLYFQEKANAFNASEAEKTRRYNSSEAEKSRQFNAMEAQKQRDYDERMSNTQYQRMVSDLKASGLNPVLALGGSGASFHGGSAASSSPASSSPASSSGGRSSSNNQSRGGDNSAGSLLGALASVVAGIYTAGASNATTLEVAKNSAKTGLAIARLNNASKSYTESFKYNSKTKTSTRTRNYH